jgi:inosine-uridine nucleoside N-ribohydrolase
VKEHDAAQVWLFDDPATDDRWVVYLVVDINEFDVVRARVLAANTSTTDTAYEVGSWFCFQHGSWVDLNSKRIT